MNNNKKKNGNKKKMLESATSTQNLLKMEEKDISDAKIIEYEFLNSGHTKKLYGK